ncbi:MAG: sulfatase-like hydrolase/transferase, partial [Rhodospirillaceae bacterium]|nr:sulfatase-like hydrolase/transferase [Rhodospirillaceae bacterium]
MTRKIAGALLLLFAALSGHAQDAERPDVLFIAIDDLNDWVGVLGGHPQAKTPNIDALAARGMVFANAHAAAAICNPSRTSLMLGLRPSTTGIYENDPNWLDHEHLANLPTIPRYFRDNGYRTLGAGKVFHAHTYYMDAFIGYQDARAWDAFYPSFERQ